MGLEGALSSCVSVAILIEDVLSKKHCSLMSKISGYIMMCRCPGKESISVDIIILRAEPRSLKIIDESRACLGSGEFPHYDPCADL